MKKDIKTNKPILKVWDFIRLELLKNYYKRRVRELEQLKRDKIDLAGGYEPSKMQEDEKIDIYLSNKELEKKYKVLRRRLGAIGEIEDSVKTRKVSSKQSKKYLEQAADLRKQQISATYSEARVRVAQSGLVILLLLLAAGVYAQFDPTLGKKININFYIVLAQIIPVLLVACFLANPIEEGARWRNYFHFTQKRLDGTMSAVIGEFSCLIAIANAHSSTMIFLVSSLASLYVLAVALNRIMGIEE